MKIEVDNKEYDVIIEKKINTKNIYIRVKEDLKIYITANKLTSDKKIKQVLEDNYNFIKKRITKCEKKLRTPIHQETLKKMKRQVINRKKYMKRTYSEDVHN